MLKQMNPLNEVLNVEDFLQPHPDSQAVLLAQATCGALKDLCNNNNHNNPHMGNS